MTIILGIDPGSRITGYGIIQEVQRQLHYIDSGCIRTTSQDMGQRLLQIFDGICSLMETYNPQEIAIEEVFMHTNPNSAIKLGQARGVAMVACASFRNITLYEYSPRAVKQSVVGYGAAQKNQVKQMVMNLLLLSNPPQTDAADALAIAICHSHMRGAALQHLQKKGYRRRVR